IIAAVISAAVTRTHTSRQKGFAFAMGADCTRALAKQVRAVSLPRASDGHNQPNRDLTQRDPETFHGRSLPPPRAALINPPGFSSTRQGSQQGRSRLSARAARDVPLVFFLRRETV